MVPFPSELQGSSVVGVPVLADMGKRKCLYYITTVHDYYNSLTFSDNLFKYSVILLWIRLCNFITRCRNDVL